MTDCKVTPWYNTKEWVHVYHLVKSNRVQDLKSAIQHLLTWQIRSDRLPAGVETTLCLLEGAVCLALHVPSSNLTLSTCINRFLNLVSHTGFNLSGLTKYYDVAKKFRIPDWIVDVRHETTHGYLPSKQLLVDALVFCLGWIRNNYWDAEYDAMTRGEDVPGHGSSVDADSSGMVDCATYTGLHNALDSYQYLKIYTIWGGVEHVRDLADQEASLYDHVVTLLSEHDSVRKRFKTNDVSTIKIREAANIARSTIHSYISSIDRREDFCRTEILMENLVNAELMCPAREFLQSLCHDDAESQNWNNKRLLDAQVTLNLPQNLVKVWSSVIQMMASEDTALIYKLLLKLFESLACSEDVYERAVAASWVVEIIDAAVPSEEVQKVSPWKSGGGGKKNKNNPSKNLSEVRGPSFRLAQSDDLTKHVERFCHHVINNPSTPHTILLLPSVLNVLGLSKGQKEEVKSLMELHLGVRSEAVEISGSGEAGQVKTLDDLGQPNATSVCPQPTEENASSKGGGAWTLCQEDFSEVPFGECPDNPGYFLDHYYPTLAGAGDECEEASFLNDFDVDEVVRVSWCDVKALKNGSVRGSMNYYDPTASPAAGGGSSGLNSSTCVTSSDDEEEEAVSPQRTTPSKTKPMKKLQLENVPAFYRNVVVHKTVRKNGRKRKCAVNTES